MRATLRATVLQAMMRSFRSESRTPEEGIKRRLRVIEQIILLPPQPAPHPNAVAKLQISIRRRPVPRPLHQATPIWIARRSELNPVPTHRAPQSLIVRTARPTLIIAEYERDLTTMERAECLTLG